MQFLKSGSEILAESVDFKLVGRDEDLKRLSSVLMRTKAASVILVGPGGVGVTSICMGLQALKDNPDVAFDIISKRIFWLKTDDLFGQGNMEEINKSFSTILNILKRTPDSILIIEDTRDFIEASRNSGCSHFINSLNALVKNGQSQVILEAKDEDLDMIYAAHSDMRQCYTLIDIEEPVGDDLLQIVQSNAAILEKHHNISIDPESVKIAIELTNKYRTSDASLSRAQPERSYNLLDRALATYRLTSHSQNPKIQPLLSKGVAKNAPEIIELEKQFLTTQSTLKELFRLQREGEIAVVNLEEQIEVLKKEEAASAEVSVEGSTPRRIQMFSSFAGSAGFESNKVRELRSQILKLQKVIADNKYLFDSITATTNAELHLSTDIIMAEFSRLSGIPVNKLNEDEREKLRNLEATLNNRVFGQKEGITKIANAIKVARVGRRKTSEPQAAFLIMGPSGVGKTEASKALAQAIKDSESALTRFDMSEYMEKHSVAKLIGAPAGYEGSDRGGILTNHMRSNPNRILLFDEIEKADPTVFDLFLQILSDGRLTDNYGRTVNFSESIIIMTTNIGQSFFLNPDLNDEESERLANIELEEKYRPEFLNRFAGRENILCFRRLQLDSIERIVRRELDAMSVAYDGLTITYTDSTVKNFCKENYNPKNGARGLQGYITANVKPLIVNAILNNTLTSNFVELVYDKGFILK